jgi:hypothetical protein
MFVWSWQDAAGFLLLAIFLVLLVAMKIEKWWHRRNK